MSRSRVVDRQVGATTGRVACGQSESVHRASKNACLQQLGQRGQAWILLLGPGKEHMAQCTRSSAGVMGNGKPVEGADEVASRSSAD
jgi:hypothetical protein